MKSLNLTLLVWHKCQPIPWTYSTVENLGAGIYSVAATWVTRSFFVIAEENGEDVFSQFLEKNKRKFISEISLKIKYKIGLFLYHLILCTLQPSCSTWVGWFQILDIKHKLDSKLIWQKFFSTSKKSEKIACYTLLQSESFGSEIDLKTI